MCIYVAWTRRGGWAVCMSTNPGLRSPLLEPRTQNAWSLTVHANRDTPIKRHEPSRLTDTPVPAPLLARATTALCDQTATSTRVTSSDTRVQR
jgi:hypothetical protein